MWSDSESPFSDEWKLEIERRIAEIEANSARTIPWSSIRQEALARLAKHCSDDLYNELRSKKDESYDGE